MGRRDLAGHDQLDTAEECLGRAGTAVQARVQVHQHAPLGFCGRNTSAGFEDARAHVRPLPDVRHDLGLRLGGEGIAKDQPERLEPQLAQLVEVQTGGVLAPWAGALARGCLNGHGSCPPVGEIVTHSTGSLYLWERAGGEGCASADKLPCGWPPLTRAARGLSQRERLNLTWMRRRPYLFFALAGVSLLMFSIGRMRLFLVCVFVFTLGSLLCGLAPNIYVLIACRVLQALGGGGFLPIAAGIVAHAFPENRNRMIGMFSSIFPLGGIIGPNLGGFIVEHWSWREVFLINVPIGIVVFLILLSQLGPSEPTAERHLD